ncbi:MAG: sugar phosphate isomerase/epimerase family protein [Planctomycetaceae bacterium]
MVEQPVSGPLTRRQLFQTGGATLGAAALGSGLWMNELAAADTPQTASSATPNKSGFRYCLNTSTIRGQKLPLVEEIELIAKAGYQGIEPWIREIEEFQKGGGKLSELRKRLEDHNLRVESAIGFPQWSVNDDAKRAEGIETFKRDADLIAQLGGKFIAAPPIGSHGGDAPMVDLFALAERYGKLLEVGREIGVTPMVEIWGPSKNLSRLGEAVFVAVESGQPDACILPDIYHIFRGGSGFDGLRLIEGTKIPVFHVNDYPATPGRTEQNDSDRVHVGDGVAPVDMIFETLHHNGFQGALSLELFNRSYWEKDAATVLSEGLKKVQGAVAKALGHS